MPTRTRRTRGQKRAANRERLLQAAGEAFASGGYHGASIEEIAEASGLSNGALYYNFGSKEKLFLALLDERMEGRLAELERAFGGEADTEQQVRAASRRAAWDTRDAREWLLFFEFIAHAGRERGFSSKVRSRLLRMRETLARMVERGAEAQGARLSMPPEDVAIAIQALAYGLAAQRIVDPPAVPDEMLGRLVLGLLRGLTEPA